MAHEPTFSTFSTVEDLWSDSAAPNQPPLPVVPARAHTGWVSALVGLLVAALGPVLGLLWMMITPRAVVVRVDGGFVYAEPQPEQIVAGDGWFAILGVSTGGAVAVLAWLLMRRHRGVAMMTAIAAGSLIASVAAWWVGHHFSVEEFRSAAAVAAVGDRLEAPIGLRISELDADHWSASRPTGVVALQALIAAVSYTLFAGFSARTDLGAHDDRFGSGDAAVGGAMPPLNEFVRPGPTGTDRSGLSGATTPDVDSRSADPSRP